MTASPWAVAPNERGVNEREPTAPGCGMHGLPLDAVWLDEIAGACFMVIQCGLRGANPRPIVMECERLLQKHLVA